MLLYTDFEILCEQRILVRFSKGRRDRVIYPCFVFLAMSVLFLLFHPNKWLGMAYGIISLFGMIGASALSIADAGNANTQRILKAVELSSRANSAREH